MERKPNLIPASEMRKHEGSISHPWNPKSEVHGVRLGLLTGLSRTGVSLARIPPGKESWVYHSHQCEEEWAYILSGRGRAEIDGVEVDVGPGDFLGFPTPSVAHHLWNPFAEDLVYLMGGESRDVEIADFPKLGRRLIRRGSTLETHRISDGKPFPAKD
jgi:uncharacterized cupin superfamily protein